MRGGNRKPRYNMGVVCINGKLRFIAVTALMEKKVQRGNRFDEVYYEERRELQGN